MGRPVGELSAARLPRRAGRQALLGTVLECLAELRGTYDAVICEGAGSPAEINLRRTDIVNMGIARAARLPVVVVGDIDRGGVFASFFGTTALLSPEDQALVAGYLVNKFRGDVTLLEPGLEMLRGLTGRPTLRDPAVRRTASASTRRTGSGSPCAAPCGSPWWRRRSARTCCASRSARCR